MLLPFPQPSEAGTTFWGVKGWYASWDSGILDWLEKDLAVSFTENRLEFEAERESGEGYLAGPLVGYQSDSGKWSFSIAPMVFSSFEQDWKGKAGSMKLEGDVELVRKDYDFAAMYSMNKYYKFFFGYKYQDMELDFTLKYDTGMGLQRNTYKLDSEAHIPTIGLGAVYPLHNKLVLSGQFGVLYSIIDLKMTDEDGHTEDIWPHPGLGFNTELNLSYQPWPKWICQLGYRYQVFTIEARGPGRTEKTKSYDITHGVTLSLVLSY